MIVVGENAGRHIADFSGQFQSEFVALLSRRCVLTLLFSDTSRVLKPTLHSFGTKRGKASNMYQKYIQDKTSTIYT